MALADPGAETGWPGSKTFTVLGRRAPTDWRALRLRCCTVVRMRSWAAEKPDVSRKHPAFWRASWKVAPCRAGSSTVVLC